MIGVATTIHTRNTGSTKKREGGKGKGEPDLEEEGRGGRRR
jgi:hypothetical protein